MDTTTAADWAGLISAWLGILGVAGGVTYRLVIAPLRKDLESALESAQKDIATALAKMSALKGTVRELELKRAKDDAREGAQRMPDRLTAIEGVSSEHAKQISAISATLDGIQSSLVDGLRRLNDIADRVERRQDRRRRSDRGDDFD